MVRHARWAWLAAPVAVLAGLGLLTPLAYTSDEVAQPSAAQVQAALARQGGGGGGEDGPKRFKDLAEVTKDMQTVPGLITLYRFDPSDRNRDPERLLAMIPKALLDQDLLFSMSISSGGQVTGFMWNDYLVRWQVAGNFLKLVTPDVRYVQRPDQPITDVVQRTYSPQFLAAVPIESMTPGGDVLIDLAPLLKSNIANVARLGGNVRPELSTWSKVKNFSDNVLIEVDLALGQPVGGSSVGVAYAFRRLPKEGSYSPRVADPRVGYFLTARMDWSKPASARDTFDRYINRWKLEKRDASLELSPPKEPIVFYIEKTVPIQWRRWVREGIEAWNLAYEKIGFDQAIIVRQQTDDNEYANYDPEDSRYNFFRWIVSGRAFAMGPSVVDPRTGQILDADILFDDSFVRAWMYDFDLFAPSTVAQLRGPEYLEWIEAHPQYMPDFLADAMAREPRSPADALWREIEAHYHEHGRCACSYAHGMQQQIALGHQFMLATGAGGKKVPERFIGEAIRLIVTHEVGHTLGLRHNFRASAWLPLEEIKRRRNETSEPITASVMDYNPLMFFAEDDIETVRHFVSPTIGPYDYWAIEYGYTVPRGKPEADALKEILARSSEPELRFATDEDSSWLVSPDPFVATYDLSSDPLAWAAARVAVADKLMESIKDWAVQDGEPMYHLTRAFNTLWWERARNYQYVARLIGGQHFRRNHKGEADESPAFVLVDGDLQRQALKTLSDTVFSEAFFAVSPELLNQLAPPRWSHWGATAARRLDYPVHDRVRTLQNYALLDIMAPPVLQRMYDAELKSTATNKFTVAEHLRTLRDKIWGRLDGLDQQAYTDASPALSSLARNLQRDHLNVMLLMAQGSPGSTLPADVQAMVRHSIRELSAKIGALDMNKLDFATRAHLGEAKSRIDRVLEAQYLAQ